MAHRAKREQNSRRYQIPRIEDNIPQYDPKNPMTKILRKNSLCSTRAKSFIGILEMAHAASSALPIDHTMRVIVKSIRMDPSKIVKFF